MVRLLQCKEPGCLMFGSGKARRRHVHKTHRRLTDVCHLCKNEPFMCTKDLQNHTRDVHGTNVLSVGLPMVVARSDLFDVQTETELNIFIAHRTQPDEAFLTKCKAAVHGVVNFLQHAVPSKLRPCRVIKGGSLGKGTAVKGKSDIDLDVMLGSFTSVERLHDSMDDILDILQDKISKNPSIRVSGRTHRCVEVVVTKKGESVEADILPAADLLSTMSPTQVFDQMRQETETMRGFYSPCLAPLQPQLFDGVPTEVKSLIRLVKYWKKEKLQGGEARATGSFEQRTKWPASYAFELIVLHRWSQAGKPQCFNMRRALHSVLTSLVNHTQFRVTFPDRMVYGAGYLDLDERHPYIMDPCNPFNNVYVKGAFDWDATAVEARNWRAKPLFDGCASTTHTW